MERAEIIRRVETFMKQTLENEETGHDWFHIERVRNLALEIAKEVNADLFVVELAALLHDIADWKFHEGDVNIGAKKSEEFLESLEIEKQTVQHVSEIVKSVSFKGSNVENEISTIEGKIVQDADRIDALGAIGIARCFAYGGHKNKPIHNPGVAPIIHNTFEDYQKKSFSSINHFYEKLLLLKNRMNTQTARRIAEKRHAYMEKFLQEFYEEWEGKV